MRSTVALLFVTGCTFAPGTGFTTLDASTLRVALEPGEARDLGDGKVLTDQAYVVDVEAATIEVGDVHLMKEVGEDGALVDVAAMSGAGPWDLGAGQEDTLGDASPSAYLPQAHIRRVGIDAGGLHVTGTVTAGPAEGGLGATVVAFTADLPVDAAAEGPFDLTIDQDLDPAIVVDVEWVVDGTLFDGVDFAALGGGGDVVLDATDDPGAATLIANLLGNEPTADVTASEER